MSDKMSPDEAATILENWDRIKREQPEVAERMIRYRREEPARKAAAERKRKRGVLGSRASKTLAVTAGVFILGALAWKPILAHLYRSVGPLVMGVALFMSIATIATLALIFHPPLDDRLSRRAKFAGFFFWIASTTAAAAFLSKHQVFGGHHIQFIFWFIPMLQAVGAVFGMAWLARFVFVRIDWSGTSRSSDSYGGSQFIAAALASSDRDSFVRRDSNNGPNQSSDDDYAPGRGPYDYGSDAYYVKERARQDAEQAARRLHDAEVRARQDREAADRARRR